jgi:hypothetical protein
MTGVKIMQRMIIVAVLVSAVPTFAFASGHSAHGGHKPASAPKQSAEQICKAEVTPGSISSAVDQKIEALKKANKNAHYSKSTILAETKKEMFDDCMKRNK